MKTIEIGKNEANQRLDRFLKKYLEKAPLAHIYRIIRKDLKVNGKRVKEDYFLKEGDLLSLYIEDQDLDSMAKSYRLFGRGRDDEEKDKEKKKSFPSLNIVYEDENILVVNKPENLLTHGDKLEKKRTLTNMVIDYLIEKGDYIPRIEKTFVPAPANRLDRNTTGLVIFGKSALGLAEINKELAKRDKIKRYYQALLAGDIKEDLLLEAYIEKNWRNNIVKVTKKKHSSQAKDAFLEVKPLKGGHAYTLVEVLLRSGRTHQIRAQLAKEGFPVLGDPKYGDKRINQRLKKGFGLDSQMLHSSKLIFTAMEGPLTYLEGMEIKAPLPGKFEKIMEGLPKDKL